MSTRSFLRGGLTTMLLTTAAAAVLSAQAAIGQSGSPSSLTMAELSDRVWRSVSTGQQSAAFDLLERIPEDHADPAVVALRTSIDNLRAHEQASEQKRLEETTEARKELEEHIAKDELAKALVSAVALSDLSNDRPGVLADPKVVALVREAEEKARAAESEGEWLKALDLYNRLFLLFDDASRYKEDLTRLSGRVALLQMFVPERLHEMRNAQLVAQGEDPLPPYNPLGMTWQDRLRGIDQFMVRRALIRAHHAHVDNPPLDTLLVGGLRKVRSLLTTPDLAAALPGLGNDGARQRMVGSIDARIDSLVRTPEDADTLDLSRTISGLLQVNEETVSLPEEAILRAFGDGAIGELDDFSQVYWPDEMAQFLRSTQGKFQGVGIQIRLDEGRNLTVVTPLDGTPAHRAGIRRGDLIRKVDGESTLGISLLQAVDRITGEAGTTVTLSVERPGQDELIDFSLVRAEIPIYSVKGWRRNGPHETDWDWFVDPENRIGYIRLTQFSEDTTDHFDRAVEEMRASGVNALIVDLRYNPGGLLSQAVSMANRFIRQGVIVSQHDAEGAQTDAQGARPSQATVRDIPVAILINDGSASASEIVAGAVQDYAHLGEVDAILVGQRSYGKGSVQNLHDLSRGQALLKLTERYYHLPDGRLIHRKPGASVWGVDPDVTVPVLTSQLTDALRLRDEADILQVGEAPAGEEQEPIPDPARLLTEGLDPQLETAVLLLQARIAGKSSPTAMLSLLDHAPEANGAAAPKPIATTPGG